MTLNEIFGKKLKSIREAKNLTIEDLAHKSGLSAKFIRNAEQGRATVYLDDVERLAVALNVDPLVLIS